MTRSGKSGLCEPSTEFPGLSKKVSPQDNAYFAVTPLDAIVGVWIALDHATAENGCMHLIEGGHKLGAFQHHHDKDCEIEAERFSSTNVVPVELEPGGVLFSYVRFARH